ncbi:MAG: hypothetical protein MZV65_17220 [Chromatiales bacterium]|nr:hypothetical protein [Chromatiales bacterium]
MGRPNVVPEYAKAWYYVRDTARASVESYYAWIQDIAKGAALATRTEATVTLITGAHEYNLNRPLQEAMWANLQAVGAPKFTAEEQTFARQLQEYLGTKTTGLADTLRPLAAVPQPPSGGSTDVAEVSWIAPTAGCPWSPRRRACPGTRGPLRPTTEPLARSRAPGWQPGWRSPAWTSSPTPGCAAAPGRRSWRRQAGSRTARPFLRTRAHPPRALSERIRGAGIAGAGPSHAAAIRCGIHPSGGPHEAGAPPRFPHRWSPRPSPRSPRRRVRAHVPAARPGGLRRLHASVDWSDGQVRAAVEQVRAGRDLTPAAWPGRGAGGRLLSSTWTTRPCRGSATGP